MYWSQGLYICSHAETVVCGRLIQTLVSMQGLKYFAVSQQKTLL
jgi:hypothetical protein